MSQRGKENLISASQQLLKISIIFITINFKCFMTNQAKLKTQVDHAFHERVHAQNSSGHLHVTQSFVLCDRELDD